jgi:hypothetical protein
MPTYRVQQQATVYYEVIVEADTEEKAREIGVEKILDGDGYEADGSFEWQDDTWSEEVEDDDEEDED